MSDYTVTITSKIEKCPFDKKKRSSAYCDVCKAFRDPCHGIGYENTLSTRKVGNDKMKQILNIIK